MLKDTPAKGYKFFALSMITFSIGDGIANIAIFAGVSSPFLNFLRYSLVSVILFFYVIINSKQSEILESPYKSLLLLRGATQGIATILYFAAMHFIPLSMAASIFFCAPIVLLAFSPILLKEKVGLRQWFTVLLGFTGMFCIINPFSLSSDTLFSNTSFIGYILAFLGMFTYMLSQILTKKVSGKTPLYVLLFYGNISALFVCIFSFFFVDTNYDLITPYILSVIFLASMTTFLGQFLFVIPYRYVKASDLAPLTYVQLVSTIFIGIIFFNERPPLLAIMGMVLIILAGTLQGIFAGRGIK